MFKNVWYCWQSTHEHSSEWEAENCTELYEQWQDALWHLNSYVREGEMELAVNRALADAMKDEDDA